MKKAVKTEKPRTTTYGYSGDPTLSILEGHVSKKDIQKAFQQEWRGDFDDDKEVRYVYAIKTVRKFKICSPDKKGAEKFTVQNWE